MARKRYSPTGLTGGTITSADDYDLDALVTSELNNGDIAEVSDSGGLYILWFDATATTAESSPNFIRPDDYSAAGVWKLLTINQASNSLSSGVILTGGIQGLNYSRKDDDEVTVDAGNCMDATNSEWMSASSSQDVTITDTGADIHHLFLCSDGTVRTDTDVTGATALSAYTKRWIGFAPTNSSGNVINFQQRDNFFQWTTDSEAKLIDLTTSFVAPDLSSVLPESRIEAIEYAAGTTSGNLVTASEDGTNVSFVIAHTGSAASNIWGHQDYQKGGLKSYNSGRYFKGENASDDLLVHSIIMRR